MATKDDSEADNTEVANAVQAMALALMRANALTRRFDTAEGLSDRAYVEKTLEKTGGWVGGGRMEGIVKRAAVLSGCRVEWLSRADFIVYTHPHALLQSASHRDHDAGGAVAAKAHRDRTR